MVVNLFMWFLLCFLVVFVSSFIAPCRVALAKRGFRYRWVRYGSLAAVFATLFAIGALAPSPDATSDATTTAAPTPAGLPFTHLKGGYPACASKELLDDLVQAEIDKSGAAVQHLLSVGCVITKPDVPVYLDSAAAGFGQTAVHIYDKNGEKIVMWTMSENVVLGTAK
ncbi:MAG TPA: hypothetical protein VMV27_14225 [Candidatus Binataceae bacterium]|nr:hypothetical protein [Candidatus Binataceae bacterium]